MGKYKINPEAEDVNRRFIIGESPCGNVYTEDCPLFRYDYLAIDENKKYKKYSFSSEYFSREDYRIYFRKVKRFCRGTIQQLIEKSEKEDHFHISYPDTTKDRKLIKLLEHIGRKKLNDPIMPNIGQFALYTSNDLKKKSPRIFFFIGVKGIFNMFCYDPFHEMRPSKVY